MSKKLILLIMVILATITINAQSQKVYSVAQYEQLYSYLEDLELETGVSRLSVTLPYSGDEILAITDKFSNQKISKQGKYKLNYIKTLVNAQSEEDFNTDFKVKVSPEAYFQTNSDSPYIVYDYYQREPILTLGFDFNLYNTYWGSFELPFQKGRSITSFTNNYSNLTLLWNTPQTDLQLPYFALSSVGGDRWNIQFGRDKLRYGVGKTSTFSISDSGTYHDYLKASTYWDNFKYTLTFVDLDSVNVPGLSSYNSIGHNPEDAPKLFINHTIEFKPFSKLSISLSETGVKTGEINFKYLNPFTVLHNAALTDLSEYGQVMGNSLLTLSISTNPLKNISLYAEGAMDQFETQSEADRIGAEGTGDPNAFGYLIGANYLLNLNSFWVKFNTEYAYTNPHLYRSDSSWALYAITRYYHNLYNNSNDLIIEPLGYKYGPDVELFKASAQTELFKNKLSIYLEYLHILKGEENLTDVAETGSDAFYKTTPSGTIIYKRDILNLKVGYNINNKFDVYGNFSEIIIKNYDNVAGSNFTDFQVALGLGYKI